MEETLRNIISRLDPGEPYVWRLGLTDEEFGAVEDYVRSQDAWLSPSRETALAGMIYLAEWYKRCYLGSERGQANALKGVDCETLWEASGINTDIYVYRTEKGTNLWRYSIYVLGGLAVRHELSWNDKGRFLKLLCRVFHGEDCELEDLDDKNRAFAFRQSIVRRHSLYEYLRSILSGESRFEDEQTQQLIERIRSANSEVLRSKFSLEWIVTNHDSSEYMSRRLRVWLKPEETGGGLHQYLRYDRASLWGIPSPETVKSLFFGLRWKRKDEVVSELDKRSPLIVYSNSGNGFVSWGIERYALCRDVPTEEFDRIDIVAYDNVGGEWLVQSEETATWMQLWRMEDCGDEWSSKKSSQKQTAVVYTDEWKASAAVDSRKVFMSRKYGKSSFWNWNYIKTSVTLNGEKTLYNQAGYDRVYARLHKDTVSYLEGEKVKRLTEDEEEGPVVELFPLIFGKEDLRVMHSSDKNGDVCETDEECETVEFKRGGRYVPWTDIEGPEFGLVDLRVDVKGEKQGIRAIYIKSIERDLKENAVRYYDMEGKEQIYKDTIALDKTPLHPTVAIRVGEFKIDVIRPTDIKEIYLDGKVHAYCREGETLEVPYILKDRVDVADFSKDGYRRYSCSRWASIFTAVNNGNATMANIQDNVVRMASFLDDEAPGWMKVYIAKSAYTGTFIRWNYLSDDTPREFTIPDGFKKKKPGDVFLTDMNAPDERLTCLVSKPGPPPFRRDGKNIELRCFEVAQRYMSYFSLFHPLRTMAQKNETGEKLVAQLKVARGGELTDSDIRGLKRLAEEFKLDMDKFMT